MSKVIEMENFYRGKIGNAVDTLREALASEGYAFGALYVARKEDRQGIVILATEMPNRMKAGLLGNLITDAQSVMAYYKGLT